MKIGSLADELRFGTIDRVRQLLASGIDPNGCGDFHISSTDFEAKVSALIEHGWDINRCQMLHDAKHGLGKRVELYLQKGADPNLTDNSAQNALHKFARIGIGKSAIRALFEAGTDIHARDEAGNTPLDLAERATRKVASQTIRELIVQPAAAVESKCK